VEEIAKKYSGEIAAIIVEPVAGNMGCIPPEKGFLESLRSLCDKENIVLIFDEVMTGFRLAPGGAQEKLGIRADLVTYGKVIGGGLPVGAFGGRREIMENIAPLGKVYQAGTLSGNPIAMIAGITTLKILKDNPSIFSELEKKTNYLHKGLHEVFTKKKIPITINSFGSMISLHFTEHPVKDFESSAAADMQRFNRFFHNMLEQGIYLPPSAFESWFLNNALSFRDLDETLEAAAMALEGL
jgi:glutamate-1-semialdehyde 2,1-aminomutase